MLYGTYRWIGKQPRPIFKFKNFPSWIEDVKKETVNTIQFQAENQT